MFADILFAQCKLCRFFMTYDIASVATLMYISFHSAIA